MSLTKFPEGWDEERVATVLDHYDEQTEDEAVAEDEAGVQPENRVAAKNPGIPTPLS